MLLTLICTFPAQAQAQDSQPTFFGGIHVNEPNHDAWAAAIADADLNSVQVTLYARHQRWNEAFIHWDREAPSVVSEIRAAKRAGLRVILVMRVALEHGLEPNRHLWHGMIWPRDSHLERWFSAYSEFVLWGADIATSENVELFVIGNELSALTSTAPLKALPPLYSYFLDPDSVRAVRDDLLRCAGEVPPSGFAYLDGGYAANLEAFLHNEERARRNWTLEALGTNDGLSLTHLNNRRARYEKYWRSLVTQVRAKYSGLVSYGANFDQFHEVGFWDALDVLAVNAYFPLSLYGLDSQKRLAHMATAWRTIAANLSQVGDARPVVLIELGWTRRLGSTVRPYSYESVEVLETAGSDGSRTCVHWGTQPNDAGERVAALQALANVIRDGDFQVLNGFTLWKLTTRPEHRTIEPFAALLQPGSGYPYAKWQKLGTAQNDKLDAAYIGLAASIANEVQARSSRSHNGIIDVKEHQGELGCTSFEE